jgi:hypothetical protein
MPKNSRDQNEINPLFTMLSKDNGGKMNGGRGVRLSCAKDFSILISVYLKYSPEKPVKSTYSILNLS